MKFFLLGMLSLLSVVGYAAGSLGSTSAKAGPLRFYLAAKGVYTLRTLKLHTSMQTKYRAGFLCAPDGIQTLQQRWADDYSNRLNVIDVERPIAAQDLAAPLNNYPVNVARKFIFDGVMPTHWLVDRAQNNNPWDAADLVAMTDEILLGALFDHDGDGENLDRKAYVPAANHRAEATTTTTIKDQLWGVRAEAGFGFSVINNFSVYALCSYRYDFKRKDPQEHSEKLNLETLGGVIPFPSVDRHKRIMTNFSKESFAYNGGNLASDITLTTKVKETLGFMGGVDWQPNACFALYAQAGVRSYEITVNYKGGGLAYPGTVGMYSEGFTKEDGKYRLLLTDENRQRKMKVSRYAFAYGAGARFVFGRVHSIDVSCDVACFEAALSLDEPEVKNTKKSKDEGVKDAVPSIISMESPYSGIPTHAQMRDADGVHQFEATDVVNRLDARVEVCDINIALGYTLFV